MNDRTAIHRLSLAPEDTRLAPLIAGTDWGDAARRRIGSTATRLVEGIRRRAADAGGAL